MYPFALIGIAFNITPPFTLGEAGSVMLFLEGSLVVLSAVRFVGWLRTFVAAVCVMLCAYVIEIVGVHTGWLFGRYVYTDSLQPQLPGGIPFAVLFAWLLIVFGSYAFVAGFRYTCRITLIRILAGALLATLLDFAIEPVAAHIVFYWRWLEPGRLTYYGVPLTNFLTWYVVTFLLLLLLRWIWRSNRHDQDGHEPRSIAAQLPIFVPGMLFFCILAMFGTIDLTHGYYGSIVVTVLGAIVAGVLWWRQEGKEHSLIGV
jgi:putative membrane protein